MPKSKAKSMSPEENVKRLQEAIKGIRVAMMTTSDPDGNLRSRPMATQEMDESGEIWFFTKEHSGKVQSIQNDQHVNLTYVDTDNNRYASISGRARLVTDKNKMEELWSPALKAWFPEGLEDPEVALIGVDVEGAEVWDSPSSTLVHLVGFAKAIVTGKPMDQNLSSEKMNLDTRH